jgi:hypothetical protein
MKKIFALVTVAVVALVAASTAVGETTRETFPFEATITGCGNVIHVSGNVLGVFTITEIPSGGFVVDAQFVPQRVTGTDELGRLYIGTGVSRDVSVESPAGGATFTFINRFHIVGTSGAPTFYVKETIHFTVTPSGEIVADVDEFSAECV